MEHTSQICQACATFDFAQAESEDGFAHHGSMNDVLTCAEKTGCNFCVLLAAENETNGGGKDVSEMVGSFFSKSATSSEGQTVENPSRNLIISINDVGRNAATKHLCVFEIDEMGEGEKQEESDIQGKEDKQQENDKKAEGVKGNVGDKQEEHDKHDDHGSNSKPQGKYHVQQAVCNMRLDGPLLLIPIYTDRDSQVTEVIPGRRLSASGNSASCQELSKRWLEHCRENHHLSCGIRTEKPLPARVLDVDAANKQICLHISTPGESGEWVALSWCWGKEELKPPQLHRLDPSISDSGEKSINERSTLEERIKGIDFKTLPPVFRDAVILTRQLGFKYLWIDSLCIIQNCRNDWIEHAARMGDIYRDSALCISADAAENCNEGIFEANTKLRAGVLEKYTVNIPYYNSTRPDIKGSIYPLQTASKEGLVDAGPVSTRAWTFQENALSPRQLEWTKMEMKWNCRSARYREIYPNLEIDTDMKQQNFKALLMQPSSSPGEVWKLCVKEYTSRSVTYAKDRLSAIAGIAHEIEKRSKGKLGKYYAGIWEHDFHQGLLWNMYGFEDSEFDGKLEYKTAEHREAARRWEVRRAEDREAYVAPSWSWASTVRKDQINWLRRVRYNQDATVKEFKNEAKIIGVDVSHVDPRFEYGPISAGVLIIKSRYMPIRPTTDIGDIKDQEPLVGADCYPTGNLICFKIASRILPRSGMKYSLEDVKRMAAKKQDKPDDFVRKIEICEAWCLILKRTNCQHEYRRVGLCVVEDQLTKDWDIIEVKIV